MALAGCSGLVGRQPEETNLSFSVGSFCWGFVCVLTGFCLFCVCLFVNNALKTIHVD